MDFTEKMQLLQPFMTELEAIQPLEADFKACLLNNFSILEAEKDAIILSEGEICKYVWVVLKGVIRAFHYIEETEVTSRIMKPHHIVISVESFYT